MPLICDILCCVELMIFVLIGQDMISRILELEASKSKVESTLQTERYRADHCTLFLSSVV